VTSSKSKTKQTTQRPHTTGASATAHVRDVGGEARAVMRALAAVADKKRAKDYQTFFKTGKGQYGEGDQFIGVTVPKLRKVLRDFRDLPEREINALFAQPVHEYRLAALVILVEQYKRGDEADHKRIVRQYRNNFEYINNWDLVDVSAPDILGAHYLAYGGERKLVTLAKSQRMWNRRIAMVSTFAFIRAGKLDLPLEVAEHLVQDEHELMHKAVGWMLREVGKKNKKKLDTFLEKYVATMPRTMLRYAIERHPESQRKAWLKK